MPGDDIIGSFNEGMTERVLRCLSALAAAAFIFTFYAWVRFAGLADGESMEWAQLGMQLAHGRGLTTLCMRPADFREGPVKTGDGFSDVAAIRDSRHAPLYPAVLAGAFFLVERAAGKAPPNDIYFLERAAILPLNIVILLGTLFFLYDLARRLFGDGAAFLAALLFLVCEGVLREALRCSPLPLLMLLGTSAVRMALLARDAAAVSVLRRTVFAGLSGGLCGMAFLAGYSALVLAVPCAFVALGGEESGRRKSLVAFVGSLLAVSAPWIVRNLVTFGLPFGCATQVVLHGTELYPGVTADQAMSITSSGLRVLDSVRSKIICGVGQAWSSAFWLGSAGPLMAFFFVSFFFRFEEETVASLRWWTAAAFGLGLLIAAAGHPSGRWIMIYFPIVAAYAAGFFFELVEKSEFFNPAWPYLLKWALVTCAALPAAASLFGSPVSPYPPYHAPFVSNISSTLEAGEVIVTDVPWSCAWYARRPALMMPISVEDLRDARLKPLKVAAIYLAGAARYDSYAPEMGPDWDSIRRGAVPAWLPMTNGLAFPRGTREQVFISGRPIFQAHDAEAPR